VLYDAVRLTVVLGTFASFASTEKPDSALTIRAVTQRPENSGPRFAPSRADFCMTPARVPPPHIASRVITISVGLPQLANGVERIMGLKE
jgi:hypothetical protein